MKMRLKGCRRCGGDLMPDSSDRDGVTMSCLQCGLEVTLRIARTRPRFELATARSGYPGRTGGQRAA